MKIRVSKISTKKAFTARETVDREEVRQLAESMKSIGQREPILIRKHDKELINGNHRLAAAKLLHWKEMECEEIEASDVTCHRLSLVANRFSRPLSDMEIGKKADLILQSIPRKGGRKKVEAQLVQDLGLHTVDKLEDCLATYRNVNPEVRKLFADTVGKSKTGLSLNVKQLREIRKLPAATQIVLAEQISKIKGDPGRVDRLIEGHLAIQEPRQRVEEKPRGQTEQPCNNNPEPESGSDNPQKKEGSKFWGLDPVSVEMPWLRYVSAVTVCPDCQKEHSVNFAAVKLSSTKDQVPKIRREIQEWLDTHPLEVA